MTWARSRVDRVATVNARIGWKALTASEYQSDGYVFLATPNIKTESIDFEDVNYISEYRYHESPELKLQPGDVLLAKDGNTLGITNIVRELPRPATVNGSIALLRPFEIEPRFLRYALASSSTQGMIDAIKGGMGVPHLFQWDIKRLPLDLPPRDEQRRIADFLDVETARIDTLARLRRQQITLLESRYRTTISELLTPGIAADGARDIRWPWLPAQTPTMRLGYVARVQTGITVDSKREQTDDADKYPYLRVANVQGEEIDLTEVKTIIVPRSLARRSTLVPGDLVMTEANGNPDNLGRGAVWRGEIPNMVHQNHIFAIRVDSSKLLPEYLSCLLASDHGRRYFRTTSTQVGIATTSSSKVLDLPIPILSPQDQRAIVKQCREARSAIRRTIDTLTLQLSLLADRRQALITAAVTGGITV